MNAPFDAEDYVTRMADVMGLDIRPEWRAAVIENMATTAAIAETILTFPVEDHVEPAPVFEP